MSYSARERDAGHDVESQESVVRTYCEGGGNPVIALLLSPFVLVFNAVNAYLRPCVGSYARLLLTKSFSTVCCCLVGCIRFKDKKWCGDAALGANSEHRGCDWVRVTELREGTEDKPMVLYQGDIEPRDCVQGQLGDCWLVSALACLAEYPGAVKQVILNREKSLRGKYRVRFYDGKAKRWVVVTVDDYIPVYKGTNKAIFMQPNNNEFWPLIIEKAMAKFMGSYSALDGGFGTWATHALTGDHVFLLKKQFVGIWRRHNMKFIGKPGDGGKKDRIYHQEIEEDIAKDKLFNILLQYSDIRSLMAVSRMDKNGETKDASTGLVSGHLFSIMTVRWAGRAWGVGGKRFVKIRNPWATFEWKGAWSDGSKEWDENPKIAKELGYVNDRSDGIFWMEFSDFCNFFNQIAVCDRTTKRDLTLQYDHDHRYCGPLVGCVTGCACFWCACQGPLTLYCGHKSSEDTRQAKVCGCVAVANDK